jgi:hypothetical protein
MEHETLIRASAVVAGVVALAGPRLVALVSQIRIPVPAKAPERTDPMKDAHTILEIATRLKQSGCEKGVALCQQLLDVMMQPEAAK